MPQLLISLVVIAAGIVLIIGLWVVMRSRNAPSGLPPATQAMVADAHIDKGERPSSIVAEQIEEMVKTRLKDYPGFQSLKLDFGTVADGSINIWINEVQYDNSEDIPDERIRAAIQEAVKQFNA